MNRRNWLATVILFKIGFTLILIALCWSPPDWLLWLGLPMVPEPVVFFRLLGMAYAALLVGYAFGYRQAREAQRPTAILGAGIVSNGGACLMLIYFGLVRGSWATWASPAREAMWLFTAVLFVITAGLVLFGGRDPERPSGGRP